MNIDLHNYEAWFILYLDNELSEAEREQVEVFLENHPELQYEWQLLNDARLSQPMAISFEPKASLYRSTEHNSMINEENFQEYLLSSLDHELSPAEQEAFECYVSAHPAAAKERSVFQQTVSVPEELIFPDKSLLFRKEVPVRVMTFHWKRIAVAASLFLALGSVTYFILGYSRDNDSVAANPTTPALRPEPTSDSQARQNQSASTSTDVAKEEPVDVDISPVINYEAVSGEKNSVAEASNRPIIDSKMTDGNKPLDQVIRTEDAPNDVAYADNRYTVPVETHTIGSDNKNSGIAKNINNEPVTPAIGNPLDLPKEQENITAMLNDEPNNKNYRGLLRRATRIIERKANIISTTEDERLLIAGFAVKLN